MRLIDADALKKALNPLYKEYYSGCYGEKEEIIFGAVMNDVMIAINHAPVIEGKELEALVDDADYDWLMEKEY